MLRTVRLFVTLLAWAFGCSAAAQSGPGLAVHGASVDSAPAGESGEAAPATYYTAEVMPAFPGGPAAQMEFLREKLKYPEGALRRGLSGKVLVQFVVDERGHLLDPKVVKGLDADLDAEALRLVRIMPWWTPGLIGGKPVRVSYTLPIIFRALE